MTHIHASHMKHSEKWRPRKKTKSANEAQDTVFQNEENLKHIGTISNPSGCTQNCTFCLDGAEGDRPVAEREVVSTF